MKILKYEYYRKLINKTKKEWCTNNNNVLKLQNKYFNWLMSFKLSLKCAITGWTIENKEILKLRNKKNSIVHALAWRHLTWSTKNKRLLNLKDEHGTSIQHILKRKGKI